MKTERGQVLFLALVFSSMMLLLLLCSSEVLLMTLREHRMQMDYWRGFVFNMKILKQADTDRAVWGERIEQGTCVGSGYRLAVFECCERFDKNYPLKVYYLGDEKDNRCAGQSSARFHVPNKIGWQHYF